MTVEEATLPPVEIWPDNMAAFEVFSEMGTQWMSGFSGATGLNYASLESTLRLIGLPRSKWREVFADVRIMEHTALLYMRQKQEQEEERRKREPNH